MRIEHTPDLSALTTLRLGGRGLALLTPGNEADLECVPEVAARLGGQIRPLGRGSNLLPLDGEVAVVALRAVPWADPVCLPLPEALAAPDGSDAGKVLVRVSAAMPLPRFLAWCAKRGLGDLSGMAGIPGQLGGAVAMNAGSYGCEIGNAVRELRVLVPGQGLRWLDRSAMTFRYRHCTLAGCEDWGLIVEAGLALTAPTQGKGLHEGEGQRLVTAMRATLTKKASTQPLRAASAGCIFANPAGLSAGKLLDEAGFKGRGADGRLGGRLRFSEKHANFLVHEGGGTATEALDLIAQAREAVRRAHGIDLQLEVKVWE